MPLDRGKYLQASALCDFDRSLGLRKKAAELTRGCRNREEKFNSIFAYVKELPYGLEDWDLKASQTLQKGWGMCSGKTNLLVALLRCAGIPVRYRIYLIKADVSLWQQVGKESGNAERINELGETRDHVDCEVWLGRWIDCDAGRDSAMEQGLLFMGASLERQKIADRRGKVHYLKLAVFDEWARERQARRAFRSDRVDVFADINRGFETLREIGRTSK
ncbi:MAG: transglutaminase domain-containing protein [Dehalococcoidia bacterium]|nr:transglutaminase domain-containing protein [Dehalococcoidia bacterium]MDD5494780.1 transglutaminase domain-containing protein [Dehalococcoidia bacterium]